MEYTLMHKNIPVLDIDLDEATSSVRRILATHHPEHLPLGTASKQGDADRAALNAWWIDRSIPASRSGIRKALETLELPNTQMLLTRCCGMTAFSSRLGNLMVLSEVQRPTDDIEQDVEQDTARDYGMKMDR